MANKTNIKQLEKAIKDKQDELNGIRQEIKAAGDDVSLKVAAEKKERRACSELASLSAALSAANYTPSAPTDQEELLEGLQKYQKEYFDRINKIKADIAAADQKADQIERDWQQAVMDADSTASIELAGQREDAAAERRYLQQMLEQAEALPVYPEGAISQEWYSICDKLLPEWQNKVTALKELTGAYIRAANDMLAMKDTIKGVRSTLERMRGGQQFEPFFTEDQDEQGLIIPDRCIRQVVSVFLKNAMIGERRI